MSAWNSRLETALRAMHQMNIDLGILTETKLNHGMHTRFSSDYHVRATTARSRHQGGIALFYRDSPYWQVESVSNHGPNVISFELVTGYRRVPCVGVYIPPNDLTTLEFLLQALDRFQNRDPIVLGDLNIDMQSPRDAREVEIAGALSARGLEDMLKHFKQSRGFRHGNSWRQFRGGRLESSRCDYILGSDRRLFSNMQLKDPRCFSSDHWLIRGELLSAPLASNHRYLQGRRRFPLRIDRRVGPHSRADALFQALKNDKESVPRRGRVSQSWISTTTWGLVDGRAALNRRKPIDQKLARQFSRRIRDAFKADRKRRVEAAGAAIETCLVDGDLQGAWNQFKGWYKHAGDRPSKPSRMDMAQVTNEFHDLYQKRTPPGEPIPILVSPFDVNDQVPDEKEIEEAVRRMRRGKAPGPSGLRAEDLKRWLANAREPEFPDKRNWDALVSLVQHAFRTGEIPTELAWSVLILIPKGDGGHRGIGLLESVWKLISSIIDARIKSTVRFHDSIHGFRAHRGTSTAIIEAKLAQQLASIEQAPLYEIFLDLKKAYDRLDRERTLAILEAYGVGPALLRLLRNFWEQQKTVARLGGFHGEPIDVNGGVTQGDIPSPGIFNIVVDAIVRYWLSVTSENGDDAIEGLDIRVQHRHVLFYADDGSLLARSATLLQQSFDFLIDLFDRVGLQTNTTKTKAMTCFPGHIRGPISDEAYRRRMEGEGDSYRARQRRRVSCPECGRDLAAGSLSQHLLSQHGMAGSIPWNVVPPPAPRQYRVSFPRISTSRSCPVEGCTGKAVSHNALRRHFMFRHPEATIVILEEGTAPLPRCELCDMFVSHAALRDGHQRTDICRRGAALKRQRHAREDSRLASEVVFTARGVPLETVQSFVYLGRPLSCFDEDGPAIYRNLQKARKRWGMVSRLLTREGASPRVSGLFYKAVVQTVLLYASETWNISSQGLMSMLRSFHHRMARCISRQTPRYFRGEDRWEYPPIDDALEIAGLFKIEEYLRRRQALFVDYVATRPIYNLCINSDRQSGSATRNWWWYQTARQAG